MDMLMTTLLDYGWSAQNIWNESDLFYFADGELEWIIINDNLLKTNCLTFYAMGKEGTKATSIKDIYWVSDVNGNRLEFYNDDPNALQNFVKNL